jgi:hypothetical protein
MTKFYKWYTILNLALYAGVLLWLFVGHDDNWDMLFNKGLDLFQEKCQKLVFSVPVECRLK